MNPSIEKSTKIGILTYHRAINYGAFLQACALCNRLIAEGYDAELIDYRMQKEAYRYSLKKWGIRKKIVKYKDYQFAKKTIQGFERGYKSPVFNVSDTSLVSDSIHEFEQFVAGKYDVIISGSDEVWKTGGGRNFPNAYLQIGKTGAKKYAYAASARCEYTTLSDEEQRTIFESINQFDYIGVRDTLTQDEIRKYVVDTGKLHINCDPSLIYDYNVEKQDVRDVIARCADSRKFDPKKKTIIFMCENTALAEKTYEALHKKYNLLAVFIRHKKYINLPELSPLEWLSLIANADLVIASFFHAICFSIKNNTPFLAIGTPGKASKLSELLVGEFDANYIKEYDSLTSADMSLLVEEHMHPMDNSDFLNRMETSFQEFLRALAVCQAEETEHKEEQPLPEWETYKTEVLYNYHLTRGNECASIRTVAEKKATECCSCGLCSNICPTNAITMRMDEEGFFRPVVNSNACIDCGLCVRRCINDRSWGGLRERYTKPNTYAFKHQDDDVRGKSRSGGFFTVVSDYVLEQGGVIYGSAFSKGMQVKHIRAVTREDRDRMRGSKYVTSPSFDLFEQVKEDLNAGKYVLYSGCPCQVAALKKYVEGLDCEKLILVDLLCYGAPSIRVWNDYVALCEKRKHGTISEFQFRNKEKFGWAAHMESYVINDREYVSRIYTDMFSGHSILNPACSSCHFKSTDRVSDFTLGDFWGIDEALPGFNDDKGVSLVLANTVKGKNLFASLTADEKYCVEVPLKQCMQNSMRKPYPLPADRDQFWALYNQKGIPGVARKKARNDRVKKTKRCIRKCLSKGKQMATALFKGNK